MAWKFNVVPQVMSLINTHSPTHSMVGVDIVVIKNNARDIICQFKEFTIFTCFSLQKCPRYESGIHGVC